MLIGYTRICASDPENALCAQMDALMGIGVDVDRIFCDRVSTANDERPALEGCLKALREGDTLVISKLDRLGRNLRHLIKTVRILDDRDVGLRVLLGAKEIDTTNKTGRSVYAVFESLAEFERDRISERTREGLETARKHGRRGGRRYSLTPKKIRAAQAALADSNTQIKELCVDMGISKATLYRYMNSQGQLREAGEKVMLTEGRVNLENGESP